MTCTVELIVYSIQLDHFNLVFYHWSEKLALEISDELSNYQPWVLSNKPGNGHLELFS
jgi:hypothetical protein